MKRLGLLALLIFGVALLGCSDDDDNTVDCADNDGDGVMAGADCEGDVDCDDADDAVWQELDGYPDADEDGEASDTADTLCTGETLPAGYSDTAGTDCDDDDDAIWQNLDGYMDEDMDGYGTGEMMSVCSGDALPDGYAAVDGDCNDASAVMWMEWTGYADWDMDGVHSDVAETLCGTDTMPAGYGDTAGTDCDDVDPYATNDASHAAMCEYAGTCVDTEMAVGYPDMFGIGACASVDCNGQDPACYEPMIDSGVTCVDENDCNGGEVCWNPGGTGNTCWGIPNCCANDPEWLTCSELIPCLSDCASLLPDRTAYGQCQQFSCFEAATPTAQHLYRIAAECASENDCWGESPGGAEAIQTCVEGNCLMAFAPCMVDTP